jgi:hypothetical protein
MVSDTKAIAEYAFDLQVGLEGADVPEYDVAKTLGMASVLAVNLRGLGEIQYQSLRLVAAHYFHIRSDVLDSVLHTLADLELIKLRLTSGYILRTMIGVEQRCNVLCQKQSSYRLAHKGSQLYTSCAATPR